MTLKKQSINHTYAKLQSEHHTENILLTWMLTLYIGTEAPKTPQYHNTKVGKFMTIAYKTSYSPTSLIRHSIIRQPRYYDTNFVNQTS
jgi:hypothetical protein